MTIQARLKAMRQHEAAGILEVSRPYISQLMGGERKPSLVMVVKAADALGCDDAELGASCRAWVADGVQDGTPEAVDASESEAEAGPTSRGEACA